MLCLVQVLFTLQQTKFCWVLSVRKEALWRNLLFQKLGNCKLFYATLTLETTIQRFPSVEVSIWGQCKGFKKSWMNPMGITKVWQFRSLTLIFLIRKELVNFVDVIQAVINNDHSISVRSKAWNKAVFEFLIRQLEHEDTH